MTFRRSGDNSCRTLNQPDKLKKLDEKRISAPK
jgi:hypothetical protein